ncbi:MAG: isoaspartyl peptidase/L-asparaginase [Ahniella sp.]|nr:isoaspartyl peptidase/L-asparaginase [Ahniella sp.]
MSIPTRFAELAMFAMMAAMTTTHTRAEEAAPEPRVAIAIHGGAGTLLRSDMTPEREAEFRAALNAALDAGYAVLKDGGASIDAVQAAILVMEESPLFNAGKGAVFNHEGEHELDAAIMTGVDLRAGAVAGVKNVRNPILAARAVMEQSEHVMLTGSGADVFARQKGLEMVDNTWFDTEFRWQQLLKARGDAADLPMPSASKTSAQTGTRHSDQELAEHKFGTVGAVALDAKGHLTAGTSTGGMTNKQWGRVGDAPVIGAGTYASADCAVSATGHGEFFIRVGVAHEICARMRLRGESPDTAATMVVHHVLKPMGGEGGVIVLDTQGRIAMTFNSAGMYRGSIDLDGNRTVGIFSETGEPAAEEHEPTH